MIGMYRIAILLPLVMNQVQSLESFQSACENYTKINNKFLAYVIADEMLNNYTETVNANQKTAYAIVLMHYERARPNIEEPCSGFGEYLNVVDADLRECGMKDGGGNRDAREEIERAIINVLYNLNEKRTGCSNLWDVITNPYDCSMFGYQRKIREGCSTLIARIGAFQVDLYHATDRIECCFSNKIKFAEKSIAEIVSKCKK